MKLTEGNKISQMSPIVVRIQQTDKFDIYVTEHR